MICPDLRGAGWTDAPPDGYTRAAARRDLLALLDHLGLDRVRLVAHDWSAIVGFQLCLEHPDRVQQYVGLAVSAPLDPLLAYDAPRRCGGCGSSP